MVFYGEGGRIIASWPKSFHGDSMGIPWGFHGDSMGIPWRRWLAGGEDLRAPIANTYVRLLGMTMLRIPRGLRKLTKANVSSSIRGGRGDCLPT